MVRISKHKQAYKTELQEAKIIIPLNKYNFSQEFSDKLHEFSKDHHKDHFKVFNQALAEWTETNCKQIADEINYIRKAGFDGKEEEIYQKIKISARFYYRKKFKREQANPKPKKEDNEKEKKAYIGLSQAFIQCMDEYIKNKFLSQMGNNIKRKTLFAEFTTLNIEGIKKELLNLKDKYDEIEMSYEPKEIADKMKKAFENRFYTFAHNE